MSLLLTPSQTVGPFVAISFERTRIDDVAPESVSGERLVIHGRVLDGDGKPVDDAVIETWQANWHGRYAHPEDTREKLLEPAFKGFGRVLCDRDRRIRIENHQTGADARARRHATGAPPRRARFHARAPEAPHDAHVFPRGVRQRG